MGGSIGPASYTDSAGKLPVERGCITAVQDCRMTHEIAQESPWFVYVLRTARGVLYTGISTDPERRLKEHETGARGARSLRGKGPLALVWQCGVPGRSTASKLEARIKRLSRAQKLELVRTGALPGL